MSNKLPNAEITMIASVTRHSKQFLSMAMKWLGTAVNLGPKRPFMSLFLGAFLVTGFLPLLAYLVFASVAICFGVFLLVIIEGGIIAIATLTLMAALILPACIACGLALFAYTVYVALSRMKFLVESAVNAPQKLFSGDGGHDRFDEKPNFEGKVRFRRARISDDLDNESDSEENDVKGTRFNLVPRHQQKKAPVLPQPQWMDDTDRVRA
ncbi:uncharacterized protein LOC144650448 [Oculina patagonica]